MGAAKSQAVQWFSNGTSYFSNISRLNALNSSFLSSLIKDGWFGELAYSRIHPTQRSCEQCKVLGTVFLLACKIDQENGDHEIATVKILDFRFAPSATRVFPNIWWNLVQFSVVFGFVHHLKSIILARLDNLSIVPWHNDSKQL